MAVHHDKLLRFLNDHSIPTMCSNTGNPKSCINWNTVGNDPVSIAGAFRLLKNIVEAGTLD